jgi:hypothetical protein
MSNSSRRVSDKIAEMLSSPEIKAGKIIFKQLKIYISPVKT